jgi:hypothetical protein
MKVMKLALSGALLFFPICLRAQDNALPAGTVLPVRLNSSVSLKTQPGRVITATVMQNVVLPTGGRIRAGSKVVGHVTNVTQAASGQRARISFTFDKLVCSGRTIPVTTDLRAMASFVEVYDAQIPDTGPDRGTPENAWTTILVGGDVDYRGGGPVNEGSKTVGRPVYDGVLSQITANPDAGCRGAIAGNNTLQALWVFSADACGLYGFPTLVIAHAGRDNPIGEIVLVSNSDKLDIPSGSGMLLRVINGGEQKAEKD